jgi:hypothetical protein
MATLAEARPRTVKLLESKLGVPIDGSRDDYWIIHTGYRHDAVFEIFKRLRREGDRDDFPVVNAKRFASGIGPSLTPPNNDSALMVHERLVSRWLTATLKV